MSAATIFKNASSSGEIAASQLLRSLNLKNEVCRSRYRQFAPKKC